MVRTYRPAGLIAAFVCLLGAAGAQEAGKLSLQPTDATPPEELSEPVRKLLTAPGIAVLDGGGETVAEFWFRPELPADATPEQVKSGVTYREVAPTELFGAVRFHTAWSDYRKSRIPAGVYTLRLAAPPTDGRHTTERFEFPDFLALISAKADTAAEPMEVTRLRELSAESISGMHAAVLMLAPDPTPGKEPELAARPRDQVALNTKAALMVEGRRTGTNLGISLTLVGHSPAK